MERKVTVVSTRDHERKTIMSTATTLGELKAELTRENINYEGLGFFEGVTKTEMKSDESLLPREVTYFDRQTNSQKTTTELFFILTETQKHIKSGVITRQEAYAKIKNMGLEEEVSRLHGGKSFTQVKTSALEEIINMNSGKGNACENKDNSPEVAIHEEVISLLNGIVDIIEDMDLDDSWYDEIQGLRGQLNSFSSARAGKETVKAQVKEDTGIKSDFNDAELDSMFGDWLNN